MKSIMWSILILSLVGCSNSGYHPCYVITKSPIDELAPVDEEEAMPSQELQ